MNITVEVKADKELLEVLTAIKNALTVDKQAEVKSMTLDEFVEDPVKETHKYTLEAVRAGKRAEVNELIKSYGVSKLTDLPEERYTDIMKKAGEL